MTMGMRIKQKRKELGLTQIQVAEALKTTKQTIFKYESGIVTNIPTSRIQELANLLHVAPGYLTGWEKEKPTTQEGSRLSEDTLQFAEKVSHLSPEGRQKLREYMELLELKDGQ